MAGKPTSGPALTTYHLAVPLSANGDVVPIGLNHPSPEPLGTSPKPWVGFARLIEWRPRIAMTQGRRGVYAAFNCKCSGSATTTTTCTAPWWPCRCWSATAYSSGRSPLISISRGRSPISHLGTQMVAVTALPHQVVMPETNRIIAQLLLWFRW